MSPRRLYPVMALWLRFTPDGRVSGVGFGQKLKQPPGRPLDARRGMLLHEAVRQRFKGEPINRSTMMREMMRLIGTDEPRTQRRAFQRAVARLAQGRPIFWRL